MLDGRHYKISARRMVTAGDVVASRISPLAFEHHAQDSRVRGPINAAPTFGHSNADSMGVSGNNPLVLLFFS